MNLISVARMIEAETNHYSGGPINDFESVGRDGFISLLRNGLLPSSKVLDFGCGSLRLGYWLIRFLDPDCYFGIEPIKKGVEAGLKYAIGNDLTVFKRPRFRFTSDNDITGFGEQFDFVIARSIFTHACPGMLLAVLKSFSISSPNGIFLASYWKTDGDVVIDTSKIDTKKFVSVIGDDLPENDMRFVAFVKYSLDYMKNVAKKVGLVVDEYREFEPINSQIWLCFRHG